MSRGAIAILLLTALVLVGCTGNRLSSRAGYVAISAIFGASAKFSAGPARGS
jgi:hypothetical protein